ncbi:hypothetical protein NIES970_23660 [[Synechococcus] sp. NIES-970]|nr:hypothetical protein NIES970_23660 [[Synechococcus] sp. NIES-970]
MKIWQRLAQYLLWFGLALVVAGLVVLVATGEGLAYGFLLPGLVVMGLSLGHLFQRQGWFTNFLGKRSTRMGTNGLVGAIAIVVIFCLTNFLAAQMVVRLDLTETQLYTLSSQTQGVLQNLSQPLTVRIFQGTDDANLEPFLDNYQRLNPRQFRYALVDPNQDIAAARRFNVQSQGEVHLEYGDRTQLVTVLAQGEPLNESLLTNSILRIQGDRQPHFYLLQGHGEPPLDQSPGGLGQMVQLLESQNYQVSPLNLIQNPVLPPDAEAIALIAPQTSLLPEEVNLLQQHLENQGSLLLFLDPQTDPALDNLLDDWGLSLDQHLILDGINRAEFLGLGQSSLLVTEYGAHPITAALTNRMSIYQDVRPLLFDASETIQGTPILSSDAETWAESNPEIPDPTFDPPGDRQGPIPFGWALEKQNPEATMETIRLVAIGNSTFVTNGWLGQYHNSDVFLNTVNWLAKVENAPLAIQPKAAQNRRLNLGRWQIMAIAWLAPIIFPLGGVGAAIFCLWQRR